MKTKLFCVALLFLIPAFHGMASPTSYIPISVAGTIIQESGTTGVTKTEAITVANVLDVMGILPGVPVKTLGFYYSSQSGAIYIAQKSNPSNGISYLMEQDGNYIDWDTPNGKDSYNASEASGLNGALINGTVTQQIITSGGVRVFRTQFELFGTILGNQTMIRGTVSKKL